MKRVRKKFMKACSFAMVLSLASTGVMTLGTSRVSAADSSKEIADKYSDEGYSLKWHDEFDGDELNRNDWNVELHEPGWVNSELQSYVDSTDNINVSNGALKIQPIATENSVEKSEAGNRSVLKGDGFNSDWIGYATEDGKGNVEFRDGKAYVTIEDSGTQNWHIQLQQTNLKLIKGHEYELKLKASTDVTRKTEISVLDPEHGYSWYAGTTATINEGEDNDIYLNFTANGDTSDTIALQINFGLIGQSEDDSLPASVVLSDVSFVDLSADSSDDSDKSYDVTSGRITTQHLHDFTYGRFEARAKVPTGKGYLPAFWLMATDENNYGQWPRCGEIDIMEVMGQEINKSYHTIHYGYDSGSGHSQSQGTYVPSDGNFADDYHTYRVDWEPDKITWYVDDKEVYSENNWYTGTDAESQITYPAPFDQDFYIILNLAVGGSWVGYPDESVYEDMASQAYYVDYVRVYQKSAEEYEKEESKATRPVKEVTYRDADSDGNYVLNADFAKDIADESEGASENWVLHLESDGGASKATVSDNQIDINQKAEGAQNHSVQLKQEGIPMYKGWEYELSFDAYADEERSMIVDIEGPDNGWTRYFNFNRCKWLSGIQLGQSKFYC